MDISHAVFSQMLEPLVLAARADWFPQTENILWLELLAESPSQDREAPDSGGKKPDGKKQDGKKQRATASNKGGVRCDDILAFRLLRGNQLLERLIEVIKLQDGEGRQTRSMTEAKSLLEESLKLGLENVYMDRKRTKFVTYEEEESHMKTVLVVELKVRIIIFEFQAIRVALTFINRDWVTSRPSALTI